MDNKIYLTIRRVKHSGAWVIGSDMDWRDVTFYGYSKKEAVKRYRQEYGLRYKHLIIIDYTLDE